MKDITIIVIWLICSLSVVISMVQFTNRRISSININSENDIDIHPYEKNKFTYIGSVVLLIITAISAYIVSNRVELVFSLIKITIGYLAVLSAMIMDYKTKLIPNFIIVSVILSRIVLFIFESIYTTDAILYFISSLIGFLICLAFLFIAEKISHIFTSNKNGKDSIGKGDVKLLASIGFMCGIYAVITILLVALLVCIIYGAVLLIMKKKSMKSGVAFAPFIYIGYVAMLMISVF